MKRGSAQDFAGATLVGERPKETTPPKQDPNLESQVPEVSYDNLGPIGKAVACLLYTSPSPRDRG